MVVRNFGPIHLLMKRIFHSLQSRDRLVEPMVDLLLVKITIGYSVITTEETTSSILAVG